MLGRKGQACLTQHFLCHRPEVAHKGLNPQPEGRWPPPHSPPLIQVGINDATATPTLPILARRLARVFWGVFWILVLLFPPMQVFGWWETSPKGRGLELTHSNQNILGGQNGTCGRPQATPNLVLGWVSGSVWSEEPPLLSPAPRDLLSPAGSTGRPGSLGRKDPPRHKQLLPGVGGRNSEEPALPLLGREGRRVCGSAIGGAGVPQSEWAKRASWGSPEKVNCQGGGCPPSPENRCSAQ